MTGNMTYLIGGAVVQALIVAVLAAVVFPQLTAQAVICALLLVAAEFVLYRDLRRMKAAPSQAKRTRP